MQPSTEKKWQRRGSDGSQQSMMQAYKRKTANTRESPKKIKRTKNTRAASINQRGAVEIVHRAESVPCFTSVKIQRFSEYLTISSFLQDRAHGKSCMQSSVSTLHAAHPAQSPQTQAQKESTRGFKSTTSTRKFHPAITHASLTGQRLAHTTVTHTSDTLP